MRFVCIFLPTKEQGLFAKFPFYSLRYVQSDPLFFFFFLFLWHALVSEGLWNSQSKFHFLSCSKEIFAGPCFLKVKLSVKGSNGGSIGCQRGGEWPLNKDHITPEDCCQQGKRKGAVTYWETVSWGTSYLLPHRSRGGAEGKNNF